MVVAGRDICRFSLTFLLFLCHILYATWCYLSLVFPLVLDVWVCDVLFWGGIFEWGGCSVLRVQHLGPVISRVWHSELSVGMKGKGLTVNSLHTQDFSQWGFWVREKLRSECSKHGVKSLPCVLEKYVRISRNYWKGGRIQSWDLGLAGVGRRRRLKSPSAVPITACSWIIRELGSANSLSIQLIL